MRGPDPGPPSKYGGVSGFGGAAALRKKATSVKQWLLLDPTGQAQVVEAGKHAIMRRTGLPGRDLRILDPILSYPSTVLGRERAIVINLEHIKAIITGQEVLLINPRDPSVSPFVEELQRRILRHYHAIKSQEGGVNGDDVDWSNLYDLEEQRSNAGSPRNYSGTFPAKDDNAKQPENRDGPKLLPFEFVALEACLEAACTCLDNQARTLEQEAYPALDKLMTKITALNLETVRQLKNRLVDVTGRVQKVRDELEHLLDDDDDMAEMYLTEKLKQLLDELDDEVTGPDMDDRIPGIHNIDDSMGGAQTLSKDSTGTHTSMSKKLDVEELEMLLEAYFIQIDGTLNKLSTLKEYVDDTEDYINIMLDDKQNHLLQMGVILTTATLMVSANVVVTGLFGMNIHIELFEPDDPTPTSMRKFLWTAGGSAAGSVLLFAIAVLWYKYKRLLQ